MITIAFSDFDNMLSKAQIMVMDKVTQNPFYLLNSVEQFTDFENYEIRSKLNLARVVTDIEYKLHNIESYRVIQMNISEQFANKKSETLLDMVITTYINLLYYRRSEPNDIKNELYQKFTSFLNSSQMMLISKVPIYGLKIDKDELIINNEFRIRKIQTIETGKFYDATKDHDFFGENYSFILELRHMAKKENFDNQTPELINYTYDKLKNKIDNIITTFRIYKTEMITYKYIFHQTNFPFSEGLSWLTSFPIFLTDNNKYILSKEEFTKVKKILSLIEFSLRSNNRIIGFLILLINNSYRRSEIKDKYVDLVTCMSVLFTTEGDQDQTYFKISRRAARFIERTLNKRKHLSDSVKKFYDLRTNIINNKTFTSEERIIINKVELIVRKAIIKYIKQVQRENIVNHNEMILNMDYN